MSGGRLEGLEHGPRSPEEEVAQGRYADLGFWRGCLSLQLGAMKRKAIVDYKKMMQDIIYHNVQTVGVFVLLHCENALSNNIKNQ